MRQEIDALKRMKDFEPDQIAKFREIKEKDSERDDILANMQGHYNYLWLSLTNSTREAMFSFRLKPAIKYYSDGVVYYVPEQVKKQLGL